MNHAVFYLTVYQDQSLAKQLIDNLLSVYPYAEIIVCTDGDSNLDFELFCSDRKCNYFEGQRIKPSQFGGAWVLRMLHIFLAHSKAEILVKLDPDSQLLRPFKFFPSGDIFGAIVTNGSEDYVQGGAMGIRRDAARKIVNSSILLDEKYEGRGFSYRRYQPPYLQPSETPLEESLIAADVILTDVSRRLGLRVDLWGEILSFATVAELDHSVAGIDWQLIQEKYAILHPKKDESRSFPLSSPT